VKKLNILITAGPTVEPIDPVRYLSNFSTGTMGYSIAEEAVRRGHKVRLVTGPVALAPPPKARVHKVVTALEMGEAVKEHIKGKDCLIMAAAVADYRPAKKSAEKIKKKGGLSLELVRNPDILRSVKKEKGLIKAGFALETGDLLKNALVKMKEKGLDIIVANSAAGKSPFGNKRTSVVILGKDGTKETLSNVSKKTCAGAIMDKIEREYSEKNPGK
jgi:phosphopantothenoylcysteine decarboxylase/phosphopantothenate--cysteine ligase